MIKIYIPSEIIRYIYEFETTYKELYSMCIIELKDKYNQIKFFWSKKYKIGVKNEYFLLHKNKIDYEK